MSELLIELGMEELPAWAADVVANHLKRSIKDLINQECEVFYTPRRIVIYFQEFDNAPKRVEKTILGPPMCNAFNDLGPTKALLSFLERAGARLEDVKPFEKGGGVYASVTQVSYEEPPMEKLSKSLESLLLKAPLERSMVWNESGFRFIRPIRWVLALSSDKELQLELAGLKSGLKTYPHRLYFEPVEVRSAKEYFKLLESFGIILDQSKRLNYIREELFALAGSVGGEPYFPEGLDIEVANLVESPYLSLLPIDREFLELPERVIMTVLAHHQRFFCVKNSDGLLPYFIAVSNSPVSSKVQEGYIKVVRARLKDALFFYREDLKLSLQDLLPLLDQILLHPKAGTMLDKVKRLEKMSNIFKNELSEIEQQELLLAISLCKVDLLTSMVKEFEELQGYMGHIYALKSGINPNVALAIEEHYKPISTQDSLPSLRVSAALSIVDKFDTLVELFKAGERPGASSDPYGMKRLAYGIYAVLDGFGLDINLRELGEIPEGFEEFMRQRLEAYLERLGVDVARFSIEGVDALYPSRAFKRARELLYLKDSDELYKLIELYRRISKIIPQGFRAKVLDPSLFEKEIERELCEFLNGFAPAKASELTYLEPLLSRFFDEVLVNDPREEVRTNRLSLLTLIRGLFDHFGDFSKL